MSATDWGLWERGEESAALEASIRALRESGGSVLLVQGVAGVGKTCLLAEVRRIAAEEDLEVASAYGTDFERDLAFGVVRQLFEKLLTAEARKRSLLRGPAKQAAGVFDPSPSRSSPSGDFAVLHGLFWLTLNACQERPLVLIIDDLQWCDLPSLRYLAYLLPRLEDLNVLVVAALRTGEPGVDSRLLAHIASQPHITILKPRPLTMNATMKLLARALPGAVDPHFAASCHEMSSGNPLLLCEVVRTIAAEGLTPDAANVTRVATLGTQAVARLVDARLNRLPEEVRAFAQASSVLGGGTTLATVSKLSGYEQAACWQMADQLEHLDVLRVEDARLRFVHPVVEAAIYEGISLGKRIAAHQRAANLLTQAGAGPERIALHVLRSRAADESEARKVLAAAAAAAIARGAPHAAVTYLEACVNDTPSEARLALLVELGTAYLLVDMAKAARHLELAGELAPDPTTKAHIAWTHGTALAVLGRIDEAVEVLCAALAHLPSTETDLRSRLESTRIWVGVLHPQHGSPRSRHTTATGPQDEPGIGGRAHDCAIALLETFRCQPAAVQHALKGLADDTLTDCPEAGALVAGAWSVLVAAGHEQAMPILNDAIARAHRSGSVIASATAYNYRGVEWLWCGALDQAEEDLREATRGIDVAQMNYGRMFAGPFLATVLAEKGLVEQAQQALDWARDSQAGGSQGPEFHFLEAQARIYRLRGKPELALKTAKAGGRAFAECEGDNPAYVGWRAEAALSHHALGQEEEAVREAEKDLELARAWGTARTIGRALWIRGIVTSDADQRLYWLQQAEAVLRNSTACLDHAKSLADLGTALRHKNHPAAARRPLREAMDLAARCGATPLVGQVRAELGAAGGRPRRTALTGPEALTHSEHRVAELASRGVSNRQIAQALFVTPRTVEVHLSAAYRKLKITGRGQLAAALNGVRSEHVRPDIASTRRPDATDRSPQVGRQAGGEDPAD